MYPVSSFPLASTSAIPAGENRQSDSNQLVKNIITVANSPTSFDKEKTRKFFSEKLSEWPSFLKRSKKNIISLPSAVEIDQFAKLKKNISATDAVYLYDIPGKGEIIVKKFGNDEVIDSEERLYQEINAAQEVFVSELAKILDINVPNRWLISEPGKGDTSVASSFIDSTPLKTSTVHHKNEIIVDGKSFEELYSASKLPAFHYLINHPDITSDDGVYKNIIVRGDGELFSIDHADTFMSGKSTPSFTPEQLRAFLPDRKKYNLLKSIDLKKSILTSFNPVLKKYGEYADIHQFINIKDLEFRRDQIIHQYKLAFGKK
ncbi:hypothetical protein ABW286_17335 [Erwinia papayae]|uniref:Uncharacterized protein n=1 Tax=Erwinia papayae TaxID=206499 RepID=A0ABV3N530_9GAMM